jgi:CRP-like cAMP-binding protein
MDATVPSLPASRLFDSLLPAERDSVLALAIRRTIPRGRALFRQGEPATTLYLIEHGYLKLTQVTGDGSEVIIRFAGPGAPIGGVAALGGAVYPIAATASDAAAVVGWSGTSLASILDRHPALRTNIMREMSAHMGEALMRVGEMATERVTQRIARALLRIAEHCGRATSTTLEIPHSLTRQELAEMAGTTLFSVSRILNEWEAAGLVRSARARVRITDIPSLRRLAEDGASADRLSR